MQRSGARPESAHDFFVVVSGYREAYTALRAAGGLHVRPAVAIALAHVLQPNVVALNVALEGRTRQAKCAVLTLADLQRAAAGRAKDHFTRGRLFQQVQLLWSRDPDSHRAVRDALVETRARTYQWGRPYLPGEFDAEIYSRALLETSFAAEVRPEGNERITQLLAAQSETMCRIYGELLRAIAQQRILTPVGIVYRQTTPPSTWERLVIRLYFMRSKARATMRWFKHVVLYENWLDYIVQKITRRTGMSVELTARERRWPLIFLWPKAIQFLRTRPQRRR
ncbi:MAG TPA: hypothetical protein VJ596_11020 [Gemmatimonadaceae bacterium]|nr:hypothetical protein [Gemmatimonadaceae bacterium]